MPTTSANLPRDERQDFLKGVADLGFDSSEFMLSAKQTTPQSGVGPLKITVSVERKSRGTPVALEYDGGHGSDWVNSALADVKSTRFGIA